MHRIVAVAAVLAVATVGCGDADGDPAVEAVATQAERVAELLEQGEDCRALEATTTLESLADDPALAEEAHAGVARWADQARQQLSCAAPTESTTPSPTPSPPAQGEPPPPPDADEQVTPDADEQASPDEDDGAPPDEDEGGPPDEEDRGPPDEDDRGPPDDRGEGDGPDDNPGRGRGRDAEGGDD